MFSAGHVGTVAARRPRQPFNPFTPSRDDDLDDRGRIPAHELILFTELCEETESRFRKRKKKQRRPLTNREEAELRESEAMMDAHYTSYDNVLRYVFLRFKSPPYPKMIALSRRVRVLSVFSMGCCVHHQHVHNEICSLIA